NVRREIASAHFPNQGPWSLYSATTEIFGQRNYSMPWLSFLEDVPYPLYFASFLQNAVVLPAILLNSIAAFPKPR
ncbi:MAG: hypothetical protein KDB27_25565, partial [Planctomycetales bacterium]|nr:hypothetical protein [Planctomycetales bacterium]